MAALFYCDLCMTSAIVIEMEPPATMAISLIREIA